MTLSLTIAMRHFNRATYTDLAGDVRLLGCPACGYREGLRTDADDEDIAGFCENCGSAYDARDLGEMRWKLEELDAAAYDFVTALIGLANGSLVPSPFGVDPIDGEIPTVTDLVSYHHGASADPEAA